MLTESSFGGGRAFRACFFEHASYNGDRRCMHLYLGVFIQADTAFTLLVIYTSYNNCASRFYDSCGLKNAPRIKVLRFGVTIQDLSFLSTVYNYACHSVSGGEMHTIMSKPVIVKYQAFSTEHISADAGWSGAPPTEPPRHRERRRIVEGAGFPSYHRTPSEGRHEMGKLGKNDFHDRAQQACRIQLVRRGSFLLLST